MKIWNNIQILLTLKLAGAFRENSIVSVELSKSDIEIISLSSVRILLFLFRSASGRSSSPLESLKYRFDILWIYFVVLLLYFQLSNFFPQFSSKRLFWPEYECILCSGQTKISFICEHTVWVAFVLRYAITS